MLELEREVGEILRTAMKTLYVVTPSLETP